MKIFKKQWLEEIKKIELRKQWLKKMKAWIKYKLQKKKKEKDVNDVMQKESCKIYCKTFILYIL